MESYLDKENRDPEYEPVKIPIPEIPFAVNITDERLKVLRTLR